MSYHRSHHRVHRRHLVDYFLPLFLFIAFALVIILARQLYVDMFVKHEPLDAYLFIPQGQVQILPAGSFTWDFAVNETRVVAGDEFTVGAGGRGTVRFFQRLWMRMNGDSGVLLSKIVSGGGGDQFEIGLKSGQAWFNTEAYRETSVEVSVVTAHLRINSDGGVFEVENSAADSSGGAEAVRVLRGKVEVTVLVQDSDTLREVETLEVGEGQEFSMTASVYSAYQKFQSPEVVGPVNKNFVEGEWYLWNSAEDEKLEAP